MSLAEDEPIAMNEGTIELIAERVVAALRHDLDAIAADLLKPATSAEQLTVSQLARRLGVARSTVYAHWKEWGGYRLGKSEKAPIRFDGNALPLTVASPAAKPPLASKPTPKYRSKKRRRRDLLMDAPRLVERLDETA